MFSGYYKLNKISGKLFSLLVYSQSDSAELVLILLIALCKILQQSELDLKMYFLKHFNYEFNFLIVTQIISIQIIYLILSKM